MRSKAGMPKARFFVLTLLFCLPIWIGIFGILGFSYSTTRDWQLHEVEWVSNPGLYEYQFAVNNTLNWLIQQISTRAPDANEIPRFNLNLTQDAYDRMVRTDAGHRGTYARATIETNTRTIPVRVRNRGGFFWHYLYPKKSWRIKPQIEGSTNQGPDRSHVGLTETNEFDFIAPKVYPPWDPLLDRWADRAGLANFGSRLVALYINRSFNGIGYQVPNLSTEFLSQIGLPDGEVYGVDAEIMENIPERQSISAAWEDGRKWLVLHKGPQEVARRALVELVASLKLSPREFDARYRESGKLSGFINQLAFNSYFGIFHTRATANVKVHVSPSGNFTPLAWDYLWPGYITPLFYSGHPIFNKLQTSPYFVEQLTDRLASFVKARLPWDEIRGEATEYLGQIRRIMRGDPNRLSLFQLDWIYDLHVFHIMRGLNERNMRYFEQAGLNAIRFNIEKTRRKLSEIQIEYAPWFKPSGFGISLVCRSWRPCWIHGVRILNTNRNISLIPDHNCDQQRDVTERTTAMLKLYPGLKEVQSPDPRHLNPVFPSHEAIHYDLGRMPYPFFANQDLDRELEFLVTQAAEGPPRWISGSRIQTSSDHISFHPWGKSCDQATL